MIDPPFPSFQTHTWRVFPLWTTGYPKASRVAFSSAHSCNRDLAPPARFRYGDVALPANDAATVDVAPAPVLLTEAGGATDGAVDGATEETAAAGAEAWAGEGGGAEAVGPLWLKHMCEVHFGGGPTPVQDMCMAIFDMLASPKGDDLLQNDLFELMGFDKCAMADRS